MVAAAQGGKGSHPKHAMTMVPIRKALDSRSAPVVFFGVWLWVQDFGFRVCVLCFVFLVFFVFFLFWIWACKFGALGFGVRGTWFWVYMDRVSSSGFKSGV